MGPVARNGGRCPITRTRILLVAVGLAIVLGLCTAGRLRGGDLAPVALMTFAVAAFVRPVP